MTQQPQAIERGLLWDAGPDQPQIKILDLDSERITVAILANGPKDYSAEMSTCTWTEFRDWQQRHAARVQGGRDE